MADRMEQNRAEIDAGTGVVVQRAIATGLRQRLALDTSPVPATLQRLLDELRRQEAAVGNP